MREELLLDIVARLDEAAEEHDEDIPIQVSQRLRDVQHEGRLLLRIDRAEMAEDQASPGALGLDPIDSGGAPARLRRGDVGRNSAQAPA